MVKYNNFWDLLNQTILAELKKSHLDSEIIANFSVTHKFSHNLVGMLQNVAQLINNI